MGMVIEWAENSKGIAGNGFKKNLAVENITRIFWCNCLQWIGLLPGGSPSKYSIRRNRESALPRYGNWQITLGIFLLLQI